MDSHIDLSQPNITKIRILKKNDEIPATKEMGASNILALDIETKQLVCPSTIRAVPVTEDIPRRNSLEPVQLKMSMVVSSEIIKQPIHPS
jgi:uncharacterized protein YbaR (Trm112 family)